MGRRRSWSGGGHGQRLAGLDDSHGTGERVSLKNGPKPFDRIVRSRGHVTKSPPAIRHEESRAKPLEEHERIVVGEMAASESRLPARSVADGQKRQVERAAFGPEAFFD